MLTALPQRLATTRDGMAARPLASRV
ncbi:hypothetical protein CBM2634_A230005 [Cupriavidus taiwanensis]|uniref:Uncharacterized protein n=1 Tax=Cupriavidus taiwanensis TaxID=164546 RepID=A0A375IY97_9BURK|nr:hypothetical protein CBM2634_A230005 [Cupriavidus taiwanensis]